MTYRTHLTDFTTVSFGNGRLIAVGGMTVMEATVSSQRLSVNESRQNIEPVDRIEVTCVQGPLSRTLLSLSGCTKD